MSKTKAIKPGDLVMIRDGYGTDEHIWGVVLYKKSVNGWAVWWEDMEMPSVGTITDVLYWKRTVQACLE